MFVGALAGFKIGLETGNPWLGLILAMVAGMALALLHAIVCIHFQADQIVSGLALTFVGTGVALVLGEGLATAQTGALLPTLTLPVLSLDPVHRPRVLHRPERPGLRRATCWCPWPTSGSTTPDPGMHLRAVGEQPSAADALGVDVYRTRYAYTLVGGALAGLAGATISMAVTPGWFADKETSGLGWIAVGLGRSSPSGARVGR